MRRTHAIGFQIISAASLAFAASAEAQPAQFGTAIYQTEVSVARSACSRAIADAQCTKAQDRLLKTVLVKAAQSASKVSLSQVADRQLDALISTFN